MTSISHWWWYQTTPLRRRSIIRCKSYENTNPRANMLLVRKLKSKTMCTIWAFLRWIARENNCVWLESPRRTYSRTMVSLRRAEQKPTGTLQLGELIFKSPWRQQENNIDWRTQIIEKWVVRRRRGKGAAARWLGMRSQTNILMVPRSSNFDWFDVRLIRSTLALLCVTWRRPSVGNWLCL